MQEQEIFIDWLPQPRQLKFLRACGLSHPFDGGEPRPPVADVIGYGGAAGGGKSDSLMAVGIISCLTYPKIKVGYFRRKYTELQGSGGAIQRSQELLASLEQSGLVKYNGSDHRWTFWHGATLTFCHLQHEKDQFSYQSQQFDILLFDEGTQFLPSQIRYMMTRNRATIDGFTPFTAMGTNPGNVGHGEFKRGFIEIGEPEIPHKYEFEEGKFETHIFIPARLSDNQILETRDPNYRKKLENQPEFIRRQLLEGDWDVAEGMAFDEWRKPIHVCAPFEVPEDWIRFTALDWGYAKPYSVGWYAVDYDGRLWKYRELYGWSGKPDVGTKEGPEEVAKKMLKLETYRDESGRERKENIRYRSADDAIFGGRQDNSKSIAEQFSDAGVYWQPVGKGKGSRKSGKLQVHHRLKWEKDANGLWNGERPMLVVFNNCVHTIRTLPNMILDDDDPEDVDTTLEDHAYDETRYACMSRPITPREKKPSDTRVQKHKRKLMSTQSNHNMRIV